MKPISKKMRHLFLGTALILTAVLVWWGHIYSPLLEQKDELVLDISKKSQRYDLLEQRLRKLSKKRQNNQKEKASMARFSKLIVPGNSLEDVSAHTQHWVQEYLINYDLTIKSYKGLSPSKWQGYPLAQVEFQLGANTQGLSDLLEDLEKMEKAVRIEKLSVTYRRSKENDLRVSLRLGTLFVEGHKE